MKTLASLALLASLSQAFAQPTAAQFSMQTCPNLRAELISAGFPKEAMRLRLENGEVVVQFTLDMDSKIKDAVVLRSTHEVFSAHALQIVSKLSCQSPGQELKVVLPLRFRVA